MAINFISADYGFLQSPDGKESARTKTAMDILMKHFPEEDHVLVFDNATMHLKCPDEALSASKMTKGVSAFRVMVNVLSADGKPTYSADGKLLKQKEQDLYFAEDHENARLFKGMAIILQERGMVTESKKKAQCGSKFSDCPEGAIDCCCQCTLYNQPDFVAVKSRLEMVCKVWGFQVLFLPKFHCELNFIEQCWRYAKQVYHMCPPSSKEDNLEQNILEVLNSIPLMFATHSLRFMDAYCKGLNGKWAAWASKRYHGHRVLSEGIFAEIQGVDVAGSNGDGGISKVRTTSD
ncbi:hypothetical protein ARMGADRAFT_1041776 [Armillaria gallica]|uniref:Tc1-like transposase DDE domain-containing protein n=1 Tax=Armillaria gallica TaxID=47427 RepID=A0A2H3EAM1_ARMGA|nr:hypothetical protein ARMGADRAFT_1041776 [Armillaria gallica]